jgi:hypothetical protein
LFATAPTTIINLPKTIMFDFNNPYLGTQAKRDMLHLEVSEEYREEKKRMAKAGMRCSSPSYWLLSISEFIELAKASKSLDTLFTGELYENLYHPSYQVLLMEHDRVEAGEWDCFYHRFSPVGYQSVCVIGINGFLEGEVPKSPEEIESADFRGGVFSPTWEQHGHEIEAYEETAYWSKKGVPFFPIDIWDIPIKELNEYEDKRVYKRTYFFSEWWEQLLEKERKKIKKELSKRPKNKAGLSLIKSTRGFTSNSKKKVKKSKKVGGKK